MLTGTARPARALTEDQARRVQQLLVIEGVMSSVLTQVDAGTWLVTPNPGPLLGGRSPVHFLTAVGTPGYVSLLRQVQRWTAGATGADTPRDRPLVTRSHDGRRLVVAGADAAALALGLHPGLALAEAQARVPGLQVTEADSTGDVAALGRLAAWCLRYAHLRGTAADGGGAGHRHRPPGPGGVQRAGADWPGRAAARPAVPAY